VFFVATAIATCPGVAVAAAEAFGRLGRGSVLPHAKRPAPSAVAASGQSSERRMLAPYPPVIPQTPASAAKWLELQGKSGL
jgi:hypothetical protein